MLFRGTDNCVIEQWVVCDVNDSADQRPGINFHNNVRSSTPTFLELRLPIVEVGRHEMVDFNNIPTVQYKYSGGIGNRGILIVLTRLTA